ncbi:Carboxypeptidase B [Orchesella cincta]|uniref:Carboxypeptidase B n=1 Tax=Orchesella cincta TaxID=48709 RepID=A0A1D2NMM8_ORCCI|nr:Carboxypeptidase B [Orchesella cincta]
MKTSTIVFSFLGILALTVGLPQTYEEQGSKVFRVLNAASVENGLEKLQHLQVNENFDFWTKPSVKVATDIFVQPERIGEFEKYMKDNGFTYSVMIEDVGKLILQERALNRQGPDMDWDNYQRYETIFNFVGQSALSHSDIASVEEIGKTTENRTMIVIKIGKPASTNRTKPAIFMDGGIHAREWISPALTTYFINQLVNNYTSYDDMLSEVDIYILPVANPDGYEFTHGTTSGARMWRKNRRPDPQCAGVDLNRNFGYEWGGPGTSPNKCSEIYKGTAAFSEPESTNIKNFIERKAAEGVNWRAYFAMHSYAQILEMLVWLPNPVHGTRYEVGSVTELLSPGAGGSDDWAKGSGIFKYSQTVEVRDTGEHGFILPPTQIKDCALETWEAIRAIAKFLAEE